MFPEESVEFVVTKICIHGLQNIVERLDIKLHCKNDSVQIQLYCHILIYTSGLHRKTMVSLEKTHSPLLGPQCLPLQNQELNSLGKLYDGILVVLYKVLSHFRS